MIDFLSKKTLAKTLELTTDSVIKILDKSDILSDTGLPLGKIIKYIAGKIISISDVNVAFKKVFLKAFHISIHTTVSRHVKELEINENELLKIQDLHKSDFFVSIFDIENIEENKIFNDCLKVYDSILRSSDRLTEYQIQNIFFSIPIQLKINIVEILENNPKVFEKFQSFLDSETYKLYLNKKILDSYRLKISQYIFSKCFFNTRTTKYDYYIETGFSVYYGFLDEKANQVMYKTIQSIIKKI